MIRVALFDDNREQRDALCALLDDVDATTCAGAFADARNAVADVEACLPDVVLMDIDMPGINGIQATAELRQKFTDLRVIMLTVIEDDDRIFAAIRAGADGYFLKQTAPLKLIDGIAEAMEGGAPMSPGVARRVLGMVHGPDREKEAEKFQLTEREHEILGLLVKGWTYKRIAAELGIAFPTVNKHVGHVYVKLRVKSVGEAVALAVRRGLA
ncbi:MAG: response regulator transcription factor [Flavobacteriales bacterium]|nr:response regulator transcription factor [Flavobacteriales bacterium]